MPNPGKKVENSNWQSPNEFPRQQKIAVVFLAVLGIFIIVLGVWQLSARLKKPFTIDNGSGSETSEATTTDSYLRDTDGDGLTDYDEVNIYGTSPYLEDSDSDNISDKQEITQGTDPNCMAGKKCNTADTAGDVSADVSAAAATTSDDLLGLESYQEALTAAASASGEVSASAVTPAQIRQALLDSGINKEDLDKISDDDLVRIYQESLEETPASSGATGQ